MQIGRRGQTQCSLQINLPRRGSEQIGAAHHMRDALRVVVNRTSEVVGINPIGAKEHEVADLALEILAHASLQEIHEFDRRIVGAHAPCPRFASRRQAVAAGAGIDRAGPSAESGHAELPSTAWTGITKPARSQSISGYPVIVPATGL